MHVMRTIRALACVAGGLCVVALGGCPSLDGFSAHYDAGGAPADASDDQSSSDGGADGGDAASGTSFLPLAEAAKFCTKALDCYSLGLSAQTSLAIPVDVNNYSACMNWIAGPLPPDRPGIPKASAALKCAADAMSCNAAGACMWIEFVGPGDPRCVGYTGGNFGECTPTKAATLFCDFNFIAHCDNPAQYAGSSCLGGAFGPDGGITEYFCAVSSGACSGGGSNPACDGSFFTHCNGGLQVGFDCEVQGMSCSLSGCATTGGHKGCGMPAVSCAGDNVETCDGLEASDISCGPLGGKCDGSAVAKGGVPLCASTADKCSPYDKSANVCTGDTISLCIGGQPTTFDCTSVGMHCAVAGGGLSARCE